MYGSTWKCGELIELVFPHPLEGTKDKTKKMIRLVSVIRLSLGKLMVNLLQVSGQTD